MSDAITIEATERTVTGKGASRRLRRQGLVPAIIYGGDADPVQINLKHEKFFHALDNEAIYTQVLNLKVGNKKDQVILRDLQRHPYKQRIIHADFFRVNAKTLLTVTVPFHFINAEDCIGVKQEGGILSHIMSEVEVICLPKDIPEFIEVDVKGIALGSSLHLSEIVLPKSVEIVALSHGDDHDSGVAAVTKAREEKEISDEDTAADDDAEAETAATTKE